MSTKTIQRRSRFFVDWKIQGGIVRRILLHWVSFVVVGTTIACLVRWMTHPTVPLSDQIGAMFAQFGPFLAAMLAMLPIFVLDTIKLTNRFAGPFVRFRRTLGVLRDGEATQPLTFRNGDYWLETEADLNAVFNELTSLRKEVAVLKANAGQSTTSSGPVEADISELAASSPGNEAVTPVGDGGVA